MFKLILNSEDHKIYEYKDRRIYKYCMFYSNIKQNRNSYNNINFYTFLRSGFRILKKYN